ncbi:MAG TPA: glycosyltransferase [Blastocatellia bacterium]|nr:glycosyltransferase [Blastocatellia bacterium]
MDAGSTSKDLAASIIVPTRNRADLVARFLPSLADQATSEPYEVIYVDNGSTDSTKDLILESSERWPHVRMIEERRAGGARARHAGALAARSPLLIFVDDDMLAEPNLVAEHLRAHKEAPGGCVLGNIISAPGRHPFERMMAYIYDGPKSTLASREPTAQDYWSGNVSISRELYFRLGGYSEELASLRCGEDMEFGLRMVAAGIRLRFAERAVTHHHFTERFGARLYRSYRTGIARAYLKERHPELPIVAVATVRSRWRARAVELFCLAAARVMEPFAYGKGVPFAPLAFVYELGLRTAAGRGMIDYAGGRAGQILIPVGDPEKIRPVESLKGMKL